MRRLLIVAVLLAPGPAPDPMDVIRWSRARAYPPSRGRCTLTIDRGAHPLVVLLDGERVHVAVLGPLGSPRAIFRSDGERARLDVGGEAVVAGSASDVLRSTGWPDIADWSGLLRGAVPERAVTDLEPLADGSLAVTLDGLGGWSALLSPQGALSVLSWGGSDAGVAIARSGEGLATRLTGHGLLTFDLGCVWEPAVIPAAAFAVDGHDRPGIPIEELGRRVGLELAMLRGPEVR